MKRWQIVLIVYLLSVPIPSLIMQVFAIELYYEQTIWWVFVIHMLPMGFIGTAMGARTLGMMALSYWMIAVPLIAACFYVGRRRRN